MARLRWPVAFSDWNTCSSISSLRPARSENSVEHGGDALFRRVARHQRGDGDGAGIDHGVERPVGDLVEHDRVERFAGRLDADMPQHVLAAIMLERVAVHERLRDRLDGEEVVGVAGGVDLAVDRGERDAEGGGSALPSCGI